MKLPGLGEIDEEMEKKIALAADDVGEIFLAHGLPRHIGVMALCRMLAYCLLDYPASVRDIVRKSMILGVWVAMEDRVKGSSGVDIDAEVERLIEEALVLMRREERPRRRRRAEPH